MRIQFRFNFHTLRMGEVIMKIIEVTFAMLIVLHGMAFAFETTFGGSGDDYAKSLQQTSDGGFIVAGYTNSYGNGREDVFLIKTDAYGAEQWSKTFGGASRDYGESVQQTSDGGYIITGHTDSYGAGEEDVYLIKTDINGIEQWSKTFGSASYDRGFSVRQAHDGGYIIAGYTDSIDDSRDIYLIKVDADGNELWTNTFEGSYYGENYGYSVQQTSDGGFIISGSIASAGLFNDSCLIKTDENGIEQWRNSFSGDMYCSTFVQQTIDGGFILAGYDGMPATMGWLYSMCPVLIKTDANGNDIWVNHLSCGGYGYYDSANSVQQTSDDGYIVAGYTQFYGNGGYDVYLIKTDSNGDEIWSKAFGGTSSDYGCSAQQTFDGGYVVAGYTKSYGAGGYDVYLIKTDANGNLIDTSCDLNGDGDINVLDIRYYIKSCFRSSSDDKNMDDGCDLNGDGMINRSDIRYFIYNCIELHLDLQHDEVKIMLEELKY